jgi:hypothetical protein
MEQIMDFLKANKAEERTERKADKEESKAERKALSDRRRVLD